MAIVFGILGLLIGAAAGGVWGAIAFAIAGAWLGHWVRKQNAPEKPAQGVNDQLNALVRRIASLEAQFARFSGAGAEAAPPPSPLTPKPAPQPAPDRAPEPAPETAPE